MSHQTTGEVMQALRAQRDEAMKVFVSDVEKAAAHISDLAPKLARAIGDASPAEVKEAIVREFAQKLGVPVVAS